MNFTKSKPKHTFTNPLSPEGYPHCLGIKLLTIALIFLLAGNRSFIFANHQLLWKNVVVDNRQRAVFSIFTDSRGLMWIGTNNGLYNYDGINTFNTDNFSMFQSQIYAIVEHDGLLYIGTNNGLLTYDLTAEKPAEHKTGSPFEIRTMILVDDNLWIGSLLGIYRYNIPTQKLDCFTDGLPHQSVYALLRDSRGVIYAGTYDGLARWDTTKDRFVAVPIRDKAASASNIFVNSLAEDSSNASLWIGTEGELLHFNPVNDQVTSIPQFRGSNIKTLTTNPEGELIVGTDNGLSIFSNGSVVSYKHDSRNHFSIADNEIWSVYADKPGNIWVGSQMGLSVTASSNPVKLIRIDLITQSGDGNQIYAIHRDRFGDLWMGGTNGLLRIEGYDANRFKKVSWYRPSTNNAISHKRIRTIMEDKERNLWIATDGGINRFDRNKETFINYHISDLSGKYKANWVYGIIEEDDKIITGSYIGGLHAVEKKQFGTSSQNISTATILNSTHGLTNDFINTILSDADKNKWLLMYRDSTITRIDATSGEMQKYNILELTGEHPTHIALDNRNRLWCGFWGGSVVFDSKGNLVNRIFFPACDTNESILSMAPVGDDLWISTISNVWKVNNSTFTPELLPLPQKQYTSIYEDTLTGTVMLGAIDEFVTVKTEEIPTLNSNKSIRLLRIMDNGKQVFLDESKETPEFESPFPSTINLTVSTLDYSPETLYRFAYKISKNEDDATGDWIVMPDGVNMISLSNMAIGTHRVTVKVLGSLAQPIHFNIHITPPWYLSWWAIMLYTLMTLGLVGGVIFYFRRRHQNRIKAAARRRAIKEAEKRLTFLSNISHDLKTPLSMIIGPLSQMRELYKDSEVKKKLDIMYENALKLNTLIHKTVELNRLEERADSLLIISKIDAVEFCASIFDSYRENHPHKTFVFHSSFDHIYIDADAIKLESVINNLLSNACKYSDSQATISCSVEQKEGSLEIIVSDDGVGIPQHDQSLVFQRMFRSARTANAHEGTGIGLYLIKKYLELHNGNIELYSKENEGTTFIVTLPLTETNRQSLPIVPEKHSDTKAHLLKILIVEDNSQIAALISEILEKDYNCVIASNGRAGLAVASSFQPDLVIVDEMMPVMNGLEMCKRLKQNPRLSPIPIIMLTAKNDNQTEAESVRVGIDIFMAKPFEADLLLARVKHLIEIKHDLRKAARIEVLTTPKPVEIESQSEKQLAQITQLIEDNIADPDFNVNTLVEKSGIGTKQLYRLIKKLVGVSPVDYIRRMRIQKAAMLLEQNKFTVSEVMYMVGFSTPSYFSKCFQAHFGCKPSDYSTTEQSREKS